MLVVSGCGLQSHNSKCAQTLEHAGQCSEQSSLVFHKPQQNHLCTYSSSRDYQLTFQIPTKHNIYRDHKR